MTPSPLPGQSGFSEEQVEKGARAAADVYWTRPRRPLKEGDFRQIARAVLSAASTPQGEPCPECNRVGGQQGSVCIADGSVCMACGLPVPVEGREWTIRDPGHRIARRGGRLYYVDGPELDPGERIRVREVPEEGE